MGVERMSSYEKLGVFYLGRPYDLETRSPGEGKFLYSSKDLVTHGVCVGMTGSGKTGLCIGLLEEAAIDGIPAIVIDPKGDMTNLLLTFPELRPEDFRPWINEDDARRKNMSPDDYASSQAELWKKGLASWDQDGERIRRLRESAEFVIYTPGSTAGVPISIIKSFAAPSRAIVEDLELLGERVSGTASSLLGLIGITADPIRSREHILISTLLSHAWQGGQDLDLAGLIQGINSPPVSQIGVMSLESFYPAKDRFDLAIKFNNLLASPGFAPWMQGEPLDIDGILRTPSGKPKISIFSIAHLSEAERMFFVALLLNQVLSWTRVQTGTTSLRAILYMDEIYGYFPPVANPPTKPPLLTLLKQARAFGLGVMLTTQNPVDLDYKGLSNTGTWFIGRLQTERDKMRVLEGLEGVALSQGGRFDRAKMEAILAGLGQRVFLMNNVHDDEPTVFETRWCMSYLAGPLSRNQISSLVHSRKTAQPTEWQAVQTPGHPQSQQFARTQGYEPIQPKPRAQTYAPVQKPTWAQEEPGSHSRSMAASDVPVLPPDVKQYFVPIRGRGRPDEFIYRPAILGNSLVGFRDGKSGVNLTLELSFAAPVPDDMQGINWDAAFRFEGNASDLEPSGVSGVSHAHLPSAAGSSGNYARWSKDFADWLYRTQEIVLMYSEVAKTYSEVGESERDFRVRLDQDYRDRREEAVDALRKKYATKMDSLMTKIRRAEEAVQREKAQADQQKMQTAISIGSTLLASFLGTKAVSKSNLGRATTAARGASRYMKEQADIRLKEESLVALQEEMKALEDELQREIHKLTERISPLNESFQQHVIRPYKKDINVKSMALVWIPYRVGPGGAEEKAWD
jgi:hypothetical protein